MDMELPLHDWIILFGAGFTIAVGAVTAVRGGIEGWRELRKQRRRYPKAMRLTTAEWGLITRLRDRHAQFEDKKFVLTVETHHEYWKIHLEEGDVIGNGGGLTFSEAWASMWAPV
jgi:hypothetical protein